MDTAYIVITELIAVIIIMAAIGFVVIRDKKSEIVDLKEVNDSLMQKIEELQELVREHREGEQEIADGFFEVGQDISQGIDGILDSTADEWSEMERIGDEQLASLKHMRELIDLSEEFDQELDVASLKARIKDLERSLERAVRRAKIQKRELDTAKNNSKLLKDKVNELSRRILSMGALEIREKRLQRDKERLKNRLAEMRNKYETQKGIATNLKSELKTSFRASEVNNLKDELKSAEDELQRTLAEKKFIESHFVSLDEIAKDGEDMRMELDRARREIQTLEQTVIEMDKST